MEIYTVSLFGHRQVDNHFDAERKLEKIVRELLAEKEYVEFLVGRDGEFDLLSASVIKRCRRAVGEENSALIWVLPYMTAEYRDHEEDYLNYYDNVEISQNAAGAHPKAAFALRNRAMIDRSDYVIFCVERKKGGAYQTMQYAQKQAKENAEPCGAVKKVTIPFLVNPLKNCTICAILYVNICIHIRTRIFYNLLSRKGLTK